MDRVHPIDRLTTLGVVPVVTLDRVEDAVAVARALADGGLPLIEVTFRTAAAAGSIAAIRADLPEITVLAGTVLSAAQLDAALGAGAEGIVAPSLNLTIVERCLGSGVPVIPGVATPTEVDTAMSRGIRLMKLFPADPIGGVAYIRALGGPFPDVRFVPTGGVSAANAVEYLRLSNVAAVGGTWLAKPETIAAGAFDEIRGLASAAAAMRHLRA